MFAEDVGIFPENQFSRAIITHAGDKGETLAPPRIERSCICSVARMVCKLFCFFADRSVVSEDRPRLRLRLWATTV